MLVYQTVNPIKSHGFLMDFTTFSCGTAAIKAMRQLLGEPLATWATWRNIRGSVSWLLVIYSDLPSGK